MSKYLLALLLMGCASTSELRRSIEVSEEFKPAVDELIETVQKDLILAPVHVLKAVKHGALPPTELAHCVVEEDGIIVLLNKRLLKLPAEQIKHAVQYAIINCLMPRKDARA